MNEALPGDPPMPARSCRLYLITPAAFDPAAFADRLEAALGAGDVAAVQLRLKAASDDAILSACRTLMPICSAHDTALILNDRPDLAVTAGADGAHIGADDMPLDRARRILGPDRQVGVSCYSSRDLAMQAGEDGADYVAFGSFFPSPTKPGAPPADPGLIEWWAEIMELPVVAIGGINASNCGTLVRAGADFLAVVSAIWDHPGGPAEGVRELNAAIADA